MMRIGFVTLGFALATVGGCALGDAGPDGGSSATNVWTPGDDAGTTQGADGGDAPFDDPGADGSGGGSDAGPTGCEFGCNTPPGDCYNPNGSCNDDQCVYDPTLAGEPCEDDCAGGGFCDASGTCICAGGDTGGTDGGDTGGMTDDCAMTCTAGAHATAECNAMGECIVTCNGDWEDCDGDPGNGCEIETGVAHRCDAGGFNPTGGCWTAYCGSMSGAGITDFGTYHCVDCATCEEPSAGNCHWCNHTTGNFYPTEACSCGAQYLDLACSA